ncbi:MAG: universal stress protein [Bacteroidota bacterium]
MITIKRILFPTDFSETAQQAFQYALSFANMRGASVEVMYVVAPDYMVSADLPTPSINVTQKRLEVGEEIIEDFVKLGKSVAGKAAKNVVVTIANTKIGNPVNTIKEEAEEKLMDLIILGTNANNDLIDKVFGTFALNMMNAASCPVLIVPKEANLQPPTKVLYAAALTKDDYRSFHQVTDVLAGFQPKYHSLHINTGKTPVITLQEFSAYFAAQTPQLSIDFHESEFDNVAEGLENFIQTHQVNLLAMHLPNRSFFENLFRENVTKKMVLRSNLPILVYK